MNISGQWIGSKGEKEKHSIACAGLSSPLILCSMMTGNVGGGGCCIGQVFEWLQWEKSPLTPLSLLICSGHIVEEIHTCYFKYWDSGVICSWNLSWSSLTDTGIVMRQTQYKYWYSFLFNISFSCTFFPECFLNSKMLILASEEYLPFSFP